MCMYVVVYFYSFYSFYTINRYIYTFKNTNYIADIINIILLIILTYSIIHDTYVCRILYDFMDHTNKLTSSSTDTNRSSTNSAGTYIIVY